MALCGHGEWSSLARQLDRGLCQRRLGCRFTCQEEGPGGHHLPLLLPVLSALVCAALLKSWPRVASQLLGLTDILRLAGAGRLHLAIPQDVFFFVPWILLANPLKSAPRFQSARLDPQHIVSRHSFPRPFCGPRLLQLAAHVTLHWVIARASWFAAIEHAITFEERGAELATEAADFWLETEDASRVQQRGRWLNVSSVRMCLQVLSSATLLSRLSQSCREVIAQLREGACRVVEERGSLSSCCHR